MDEDAAKLRAALAKLVDTMPLAESWDLPYQDAQSEARELLEKTAPAYSPASE